MAHGHRRQVRTSTVAVRAVVVWGIVGLGAAFGLLVRFGVPWPKALLGTVGLLLILLIAYALELSGVMRPQPRDEPSPPERPPPDAGGPPREPPVP